MTSRKTAHENFIARLAKLQGDYKASGGDLLVILNANQMVLEWLTQHISRMDKNDRRVCQGQGLGVRSPYLYRYITAPNPNKEVRRCFAYMLSYGFPLLRQGLHFLQGS